MQNYDRSTRRISLFGHTDEEFMRAYQPYLHTDLRLHYAIKLYWLVEEQIQQGVRTFITGLRDGVDITLAAYVLDCRRAMPGKGIQLHAVLSHPNREALQPAQCKILEQADFHESIQGAASPAGPGPQTQRMLDLSTRMLSVYFDASREDAHARAASRDIQILAYDPREIVRSILANQE